MRTDLVPDFFHAVNCKEKLQNNAATATRLLGVYGSRSWMVTYDDTNWWPTFEVTYGFSDAGTIIGGGWWSSPEQDRSSIPCSDAAIQNLPDDWLSRLSLNIVVKRPDSNKFMFECCWISRHGCSQGTQDEMFRLMGRIFQNLTNGNNGIPFICTAQDQHGSQMLIELAFLGQVSQATLQTAEFFKRCVVKPTLTGGEIYFWPFQTLWYQDDCKREHAVFGHADAEHASKRSSLNGNVGCRVLDVFGTFVEHSLGIDNRLPYKAYTSTDPQSNKQNELRLLNSYYRDHFAGAGVCLWNFVNDLLHGTWLASDRYTLPQMASNVLIGYYLYLINMMDVRAKYGGQWGARFVPAVTSRTNLSMAAHLLHRCVHWPTDVPFRPKKTTELGSEIHNARKKAPFKSSPSQKDGVLATHLIIVSLRILEGNVKTWLPATQKSIICKCLFKFGSSDHPNMHFPLPYLWGLPCRTLELESTQKYMILGCFVQFGIRLHPKIHDLRMFT
jgi:hypothetical protein